VSFHDIVLLSHLGKCVWCCVVRSITQRRKNRGGGGGQWSVVAGYTVTRVCFGDAY